MDQPISFFNWSIRPLLTGDMKRLDKARIVMLYQLLLISSGIYTLLIPLQILDHRYDEMYRNIVIIAGLIILLKLYTARIIHWFTLAHCIAFSASCTVLSDLFVLNQTLNIINIQMIILVIMSVTYFLGYRSMAIYSALIISPALASIVFNNALDLDIGDIYKGQISLFANVCAYFFLIVYIHLYFYKAFQININELTEAENDQKKLNADLKIHIRKAEKSAKAKSDFLSTMSHELRTPLNSVIGMSNLLISESPRPDQKENLEILKFSAENLLFIINDILDFNKLESGRVEFERISFNLSELVHQCCNGLRAKAEEKQLQMTVHVDENLEREKVIGDPARLTQILLNLVNNAIKFTEEGKVEVTVTSTGQSAGKLFVRFQVADDGIGISPEKLKVIFEPFLQGSVATTRKYGGTGLGLSIVKRLLELQGSQINVRSEPGKGSVFSFDLIFLIETRENFDGNSSEPRLRSISNLTNENVSNLRILVAEDNPMNILLMKKLFSRWNISPVFAENGEQAVNLIRYMHFDLVLMDVHMPVMDGYQATRAIRELPDPDKASTPIVALTASNDVQEQVSAAGMDDYITKPFDPGKLMDKLKMLSEEKRKVY
ncbi:MAG: response regulator [Mucilaginibacter polytrichastri]|nr:response regulator [Mucilaginibacter polytrichastri]